MKQEANALQSNYSFIYIYSVGYTLLILDRKQTMRLHCLFPILLETTLPRVALTYLDRLSDGPSFAILIRALPSGLPLVARAHAPTTAIGLF